MSLFFCCLEKRHRRLKTELVLLCHTWYPSITFFLCLPVKYNKRCILCGGKMVCVYICTITYIKAPQNTCFTRKTLWVIYVNTTRGSAEWRRTIEQWRCVCISMWCHIFQCVCVVLSSISFSLSELLYTAGTKKNTWSFFHFIKILLFLLIKSHIAPADNCMITSKNQTEPESLSVFACVHVVQFQAPSLFMRYYPCS